MSETTSGNNKTRDTRVTVLSRYYKNDSNQEDEEEGPSYTLTFTLTFPHAGDTVYLAHCYPYRLEIKFTVFVND